MINLFRDDSEENKRTVYVCTGSLCRATAGGTAVARWVVRPVSDLTSVSIYEFQGRTLYSLPHKYCHERTAIHTRTHIYIYSVPIHLSHIVSFTMLHMYVRARAFYTISNVTSLWYCIFLPAFHCAASVYMFVFVCVCKLGSRVSVSQFTRSW